MMGERAEKITLASVAVATVYLAAAYAICGDPGLCRAAERAVPLHVPGQFLAAAVPATAFAFYLAVDALLPIRQSVLDIGHAGIRRLHRHLFVDGERDNFWHLRIAIVIAAIVITQLLADAMELLRVG